MSVRITRRRIIRSAFLALGLAFFGFIAYGLMEVFRPRDVSEMDPQWVFHWLVCDPTPASVSDLHLRGSMMFTGDWVEMSFQIAPTDFADVIERGAFSPVDAARIPENWFKEEKGRFPAAEFYQKRGAAFNDFRTLFIMATTNHQQVFVRYFRG